ncbi:hypothetical protein [Pseudoxanthomonas daejeonensis]|uniref:Glycine zipper 2TM domain-containing protein n=1 Tax=Pseudoxanthomonas daejeonensis TaxID=266062 RepID=A0ABQ6Z965_9GAMM|nr:hypothetical protein [Pseudoxanthomonas daejeonensis]KAF1696031.1 hypothetical protein CSC65_05910 [Pseudoxanthomonas daejeonensis]
MKISVLSLALAATLVAAAPVLAQQQASPTTEQTDAKPAKPKADKKRLFKSGALGCLGGGALAYLTGKKDKALAACAVGAAVGSIASYRKQLDEARALQQEAQAAGMTATVSTKQATAKSGEKVEALDAVVIAYDPASMSARDPKTVAVLDKISALAKKSKEPLSIAVSGRDQKACQIPLAELHARGSFPPATAVDNCGKGKTQILITPVPDVSA